MNRHFLTLLAAISAAALLAGYGARRLTRPHPPAQTTGPAAVSPVNSSAQTPPSATAFAPSRSTDTVETLAALDDGHLYARLALWLADATEPDIAAFWNDCYSKKENWTPELSNLLFLHWTRLDPQHAIDSTQGVHSRPQAWWAWACHDPQAALAAALVDGPGSVDCVAEGIGKFQPDWLLQHFNEIPTGAQHAAISSISENGGKNPLETLKFLQQQGSALDSSAVLKALARDDPWAAVEWARQHPGGNDPFSISGAALPTVLQPLAAESPDELARIAERTPSGSDKLQMEAALFANLVKADPAAALEQAKAATIPRTAAERYAALGQTLVQTDPAQALQLAKDLFAACPDALDLSALIQYPDGNTNHESLDIPGVNEFMRTLMAKQPQQVMEMATALWPEWGGFVNLFGEQWSSQDLGGFVNWLNQQTSPAIRESGAERVVSQLVEMENYPEAAEWATSMPAPEFADRLSDVLEVWKKQDSAAAALWLKDANLPPDRKARIQTLLERP